MTTTALAPAPADARARLHGLDALRASALLLGIVLHSLIPFAPDIVWIASDRYRSEAASAGIFVIHLFRMPLFLLLAGYFARMALLRRGIRSFAGDRLRRIGLPLVVFWPLAVLPLGLLAVVNAQVRGVPLPVPPDGPDAPPSPGQLWFLLVLLECYVVVLVVRALARTVLGPARASALADRAGRVIASPAGITLAVVPYVVTLLLQDGPVTGLSEPTSFVPEPVGLIAYLGAFVVGWALHAHPGALDSVARRRWVSLGLAVGATTAAWFLAGSVPVAVAAVLVAVAGWAWVYGLLGLTAGLRTERPAVRYLADASYWMYLLHLPVLVAVEIPLADLDLPILVKLLVAWTVTLVVLLGSYHLLVRSTWVGRWLNGRRHPWTWRPLAPARP